jgi:hypothetical protein
MVKNPEEGYFLFWTWSAKCAFCHVPLASCTDGNSPPRSHDQPSCATQALFMSLMGVWMVCSRHGMCWGAPAHAGRLSRSPCGIIQNNSLDYFDDYFTKKWKITYFQKNVDPDKRRSTQKMGTKKNSFDHSLLCSGVPIPSVPFLRSRYCISDVRTDRTHCSHVRGLLYRYGYVTNRTVESVIISSIRPERQIES